MKYYSSVQYDIFRVVFGLFMGIYLILMFPQIPALMGSNGYSGSFINDPFHLVYPGLLANLTYLKVFSIMTIAACFLIASGFLVKLSTLILIYFWIALHTKLLFVHNPASGYMGWLMLCLLVIPSTGSRFIDFRPNPNWKFPRELFLAANFLLIFGISFSGADKIFCDYWKDGVALYYVFQGPLSAPGWIPDIFRMIPKEYTKVFTWGFLLFETLYLFLYYFRPTRKLAFYTWMLCLASFVVCLSIDFVPLSFMVIQLFCFDVRLLPDRAYKWYAKRFL